MNPTFSSARKLFSLLAALSILLATSLPALAASKSQSRFMAPPSFTSDSVVREWNEIAFTTIPAQPPFPANRWMAMVQVAVFEAVNAVTGKYEPYLGTISSPGGASPEAAAVMAAHGVLVALFPTQAGTLDVRRDASLSAIPDGQAKTDGVAVGSAAAAAILANRTGDGSAPPTFYMPTNSNPYEWQVYGGCPTGGGAFFHWQNVRPFAIDSASQFRAEPPPPLVSGLYSQDYKEVQAVGSLNSTQRPQDRTDVARLYAVANPPSLWNAALLQIASTRNDDITDTARTIALMNMAVTDAAVAVFDSKYFYKTWRPITAIPRGDEDGNMRTEASAFTPLIGTPCFPGYPSAHGSLSGAALQVLERTYGRFGHSITVEHPSVPGVSLSYSDLRDMINDISDARVYGGIHFRYDQVAGERQGHAVAQYVYNHMLRRER
jgi:hypothetical protein